MSSRKPLSPAYRAMIAQGEERLRLIYALELEKRPGQKLQLFEFRGRIWNPMTGPDGTTQLSKSKDPTTIQLAARNLWEAHVYLHTHIPGLVPDTISHQGDIWFAQETEDKNGLK